MTKKKPVKKVTRLSFKDHIDKTIELISRNKKAIFLIWLLQSVIFYIFSQGVSAVDINELQGTLETDYNIGANSIGGRLLLSTVVIQGAGTLESSGAAYMMFFSIAMLLALVWVLRHSWQKKKTTIAQAYYQGLYPIAQFFLLMLISVLQLLPLSIGGYLMTLAIQRDVFVSTPEFVGGAIVLMLLPALLTYAMLVRTLMAMFIVTIPKMRPLEAFKSSKEMLKGNRMYVMRMLLGWLILLAVLFIGLIVVTIAISPLVAIIFSILINATLLILAATFSYSLYRSLL